MNYDVCVRKICAHAHVRLRIHAHTIAVVYFLDLRVRTKVQHKLSVLITGETVTAPRDADNHGKQLVHDGMYL